MAGPPTARWRSTIQPGRRYRHECMDSHDPSRGGDRPPRGALRAGEEAAVSRHSRAWCGRTPAVDNSVPGAVRATPSAVTLSASLAPVTTICATPASRAGEHLLAVAIKRLVAEICTDVDEIHVNPPGPERGVQRHGASPHFSPPLRRGRGSDGIDRVEAARAPNVLSSTPASPDSRSPQPAKSISAPRFATR